MLRAQHYRITTEDEGYDEKSRPVEFAHGLKFRVLTPSEKGTPNCFHVSISPFVSGGRLT